MSVRRYSSTDSNSASINTYYVHKKFGYIKIEKSPDKKSKKIVALKEEELDSKTAQILDVLVLNTAKNTQNMKAPTRKPKVVKIAPYPTTIQSVSTKQLKGSTSSIAIEQAKVSRSAIPDIITSSNASYPVPTSQLAYLIQPARASSVYETLQSESHFQRVSSQPYGRFSDGFGIRAAADLSFIAPAPKPPVQQFEPWFYSHLLQLQLNSKAERQNFLGRGQIFREIQSVPS